MQLWMKGFLGLGISLSLAGCAADDGSAAEDSVNGGAAVAIAEEVEPKLNDYLSGCSLVPVTPYKSGGWVYGRGNYSCVASGPSRTLCRWLRRNYVDMGNTELCTTFSPGSSGGGTLYTAGVSTAASTWQSGVQIFDGYNQHSPGSYSGTIWL